MTIGTLLRWLVKRSERIVSDSQPRLDHADR